MTDGQLTVGKHSISFDEAHGVIDLYTGQIDKRRVKKDFYAWPYYDRMDVGSGASELTDGELLAPVLLNVNPGIHGFASLQRIRPRLIELLKVVPEDIGLADEAVSEDVVDRVADLFSVLDSQKVLGVHGTTLSKVLHRKRPALIPLHDQFVRRAYVPGRIKKDNGRSWASYFRLLMVEMQADLRSNASGWSELTEVPAGGGLTPLRALDIIAWSCGKKGY